MINRRHIRTKVMQAAYSFLIADNEDLVAQEKFLAKSIVDLHGLYLLELKLFISLYKYTDKHIAKIKKNYLKSDSILLRSSNFTNNKVLLQLVNSPSISDYPVNKEQICWEDHTALLEQLWNQIQTSNTFAEYMQIESPTYTDDKEFVISVFKKHIAPNEKLAEFYEAEVISWVDDIPFVNTWIMRNIRDMKPTRDFVLDKLYRDVEDKSFGVQLFRKTVLNFSKYEKDIDESTPNWDNERITKVDKILMVMAISEFFHFPSIPTKVSINEYIEIAKDYATAKSSYFINGVLDKLLVDYIAADKIEKIGRGLH